MFISVKNMCGFIDEKMELIESNKKAQVESHIIIAANERLLNECKGLLAKLNNESCNQVLKDKYSKLIEKIEII